jgi:hypothetical protein
VREWVPTVSDEILSVAVPPINETGLPIAVAPSWKVTVPVAEEGLTMAVRVVLWPLALGLMDEVRTVVETPDWTVRVKD